ncbi:MAG: flagellar basal body P-ring formation chaperone FlgA [Ignavibacteriaceae bacterium]|nr:flagellar basal body P-ring formation chaperone FlgA [Ignavibacteriaceae bacterium]
MDKYLKKNLSQYESFDYNILQNRSEFKIIKIIEDREFSLNGNLVYVPVEGIAKDGRAIKSIITIRVKLYKSILVTAKQLERAEVFTPADFVLKKMDITQIKGTTLTSVKGIDTYRARIILRQGEPVIEENIERKPVILSGDKVEAKLTSGSVVVSFDAFSRQDGIPGGIITIISKDKKQYKAKVIDSQNVTIIE